MPPGGARTASVGGGGGAFGGALVLQAGGVGVVVVVVDQHDLAAGAVAYPAHWAADVVLRDGSVAHLRPIRPEDADGVRCFHAAQSDESIYLRFFAPLRQLSDADVLRFTHVDYADRVALVATMREDIIGVGRYDRIDARSAEVAFNISDHFQGKGIGSVLLEHLAAIARAVLREPRLARIVRRRQAVLPFPIKGGKIYLYNHNPLLRQGYRGVTGVKTGYTVAAGRCLVATVRRGQVRLGVVLLHSPDPATQARKLLDRGFRLTR